jgi:hypothetical protein
MIEHTHCRSPSYGRRSWPVARAMHPHCEQTPTIGSQLRRTPHLVHLPPRVCYFRILERCPLPVVMFGSHDNAAPAREIVPRHVVEKRWARLRSRC